MTAHNISKETYHQGEGTRDNTQHFYQGHNGERTLEEHGYGRPKDFLPILFVAKQVDSDQSAECEEERNGNITRKVRPAWEDGNQS